jgi:hypothetical protein
MTREGEPEKRRLGLGIGMADWRGTYLPSRSPEPETMTREGEPEYGEEETRVRDF